MVVIAHQGISAYSRRAPDSGSSRDAVELTVSARATPLSAGPLCKLLEAEGPLCQPPRSSSTSQPASWKKQDLFASYWKQQDLSASLLEAEGPLCQPSRSSRTSGPASWKHQDLLEGLLAAMPLQDCCCVLSLRAGSVCIGLSQLITSLTALLAYFSSQSALVALSEDDMASRTTIAVATGLLVKTILSVSLVYGVCKGKTGVLLLWLVTSVLCELAALAGTAMLLLGLLPLVGLPLASVLGVLVDAALMTYFLLVVHSYRKSLLGRAAQCRA
ncbi:uncharacterized protein LOC134536361 [Bacillus rossius redtenbacheri]|uniref:uncharacterized protein LOC134536361 n=1 Tax=Bacillus rossius redtenbacheri TaxID=93214 RepID=UPI002FDE7C75